MENVRKLAQQLFQDTISTLTEPTRFFTNRFREMSLNQALALGIGTSWVASLLEWLTRAVKHESLMDGFRKLKHQLHDLPLWRDLPEDMWAQSSSLQTTFFPEWVMEGMKVMLTPFQSLLAILLNASMFYVGAWILVDRSNPSRSLVTFKETAKITAVVQTTSLVGAILGFMPFAMGSMISWVYHLVIITIGFSIHFNISRLRALFMVFLPGILTIVTLSILIVFTIVVFGLIVSSLFHG
jgi:hypothetical protein